MEKLKGKKRGLALKQLEKWKSCYKSDEGAKESVVLQTKEAFLKGRNKTGCFYVCVLSLPVACIPYFLWNIDFPLHQLYAVFLTFFILICIRWVSYSRLISGILGTEIERNHFQFFNLWAYEIVEPFLCTLADIDSSVFALAFVTSLAVQHVRPIWSIWALGHLWGMKHTCFPGESRAARIPHKHIASMVSSCRPSINWSGNRCWWWGVQHRNLVAVQNRHSKTAALLGALPIMVPAALPVPLHTSAISICKLHL